MNISYDFSGRTAIVTGGSRGIGRRTAERLREAGARVWVWDIEPRPIDGVSSCIVDVRKRSDIDAAFREIEDASVDVDILINCVGLLGGFRRFDDHTPQDFHEIVGTNLIGVMVVCSKLVPHMRKANRGRIVNLGSLAGKDGLANMPIYSAASAGVIALTKALGRELADTDLKVNCITPGPIETDLILDLGKDVVDRLIAMSPRRRLGTTEEVADLILWLCSDACSFSTGAVFDISGGRASY
jgi:NAD(P)-dependent dehydrogenase (short-subunit alcohol dehydrogenase family)